MTVMIDLFAKLMVFHCKTLFNLAIVQAILMWISVEWVPALHRVASRDLKQVTFSNFWPFMLIPALMLFVLLIMILIFCVCANNCNFKKYKLNEHERNEVKPHLTNNLKIFVIK